MLQQAAAEKVEVSGYLHWSIADNWEWESAYLPASRLGLYTVDRAQTDVAGALTLPRRLNESAVALRYVAEGGPIKDNSAIIAAAVDRFGALADDGTGLRQPTKSMGRLFTGADGNGETLMLLLIAFNGRHIGHLWEDGPSRWMRLDEVTFSPAAGSQAARRRLAGSPERELTATYSPDTLTGTTAIQLPLQPR